ncbi:MAG TPA: hypothetical protein VG369_12580 [Humibacter sp.]|nr:hypothetical protein [Humibacter sp.]
MTTIRASGTRTWASGWVFRVVVTLHLLAVIAQPVFAGVYLSGDFDALGWHEMGANIVTGFGYAQLIVAIVAFVRLRVRWALPMSIGVAVAETLQYYVGEHGPLWLHIPLGVAIVVALVMQFVTVWRRSIAKQESGDAGA